MREIVSIQAGQCGNQIGAKVMFECIFVLVLACTFKVIFLSSVRSSRKTNSIDYTIYVIM